MAVKTKAQILAEIASLLADNTTGDISAQDVRTVVNDITDSYEDIITAGTTSQYWRGDKSWQTLPLLEVTGSLTSAQILASDVTPITILGTPGANKFYVFENVTMHYKAGATAYATGGDGLYICYDGFIGEAVVLSDSVLTTTTSKIQTTAIPSDINNTTIINKSVQFASKDVITTGNGTVNFTVRYRIVTTS